MGRVSVIWPLIGSGWADVVTADHQAEAEAAG
jgi:hypothetical protein